MKAVVEPGGAPGGGSRNLLVGVIVLGIVLVVLSGVPAIAPWAQGLVLALVLVILLEAAGAGTLQRTVRALGMKSDE